MKRQAFFLGVLSACLAGPISAQQDRAAMHHGGMMHHAISDAAKLDVSDDAAGQAMTIRLGPIDLPAHSDHMAVAQPPKLFLTVPFDGWLVAFHPQFVDDAGHPLRGKLLHHIAFWNTQRPDFLCPNKQEHIFGAGGEMNDWPGIPGYGYRVAKGDRIRISSMFANPTDASYPRAYLEVRVEYRKATPTMTLKSVYPVWFDVMGCRESGYDLVPGENVTSAKFTWRYPGELLGLGGHLHDYGRRLILSDASRKQDIATLDSQLDAQGRIVSMPIVSFADRGGYRLESGEVVEVSATYENLTGKPLPEGAMGIVVGYFLPDTDAAFEALAHRSK